MSKEKINSATEKELTKEVVKAIWDIFEASATTAHEVWMVCISEKGKMIKVSFDKEPKADYLRQIDFFNRIEMLFTHRKTRELRKAMKVFDQKYRQLSVEQIDLVSNYFEEVLKESFEVSIFRHCIGIKLKDGIKLKNPTICEE